MKQNESPPKNLSHVIRLAKQGDGSAWSQPLDPLQKPVFQFLCRRIPPTDASDVLQLTLLTVFRKLDQCQSPERFSAWVFQIAYRQMLNYLRKSNHPVHRPTGLDFEPTSRDQQKMDERTQNRVEDLRQAIDLLPDLIREVVWLRLKEGMSFKEIASVTQSPIGTVLGRMQQGKKRIKELLSESVHHF